MVGLAKREEELYLPDHPEPLRLSRRDAGLQLLQQVRDEAHRFALSRHRRRRSKRVLRTRFDDLTGVGKLRRKLRVERLEDEPRRTEAGEEEPDPCARECEAEGAALLATATGAATAWAQSGGQRGRAEPDEHAGEEERGVGRHHGAPLQEDPCQVGDADGTRILSSARPRHMT